MSEQIEGAQDWIRKAINQLKNYQQYYERMCLCHNMKIDPLMKEATEAFIRRAPVVAPNVMGSADHDAASEFTANDIDGAYFMGVFNSTGIDGTIKELQRFKELGTLPHLTIGLLKRAATKDGIAT